MKSIIRNILLEEVEKKSMYLKINDSKLGNFIRQNIDLEDYNFEILTGIEEMSDEYGIEQEYIKFIWFKHLIDNEEDPEDSNYGLPMDEWLYRVSDKKAFCRDSGFITQWVNPLNFGDIETKGKKILFGVGGWYEFADLFDEKTLAENVLSEDWAELYDVWGTDMGEIFNNLNETGIRKIQDYIIENVDEIVEIGHREEFWDLTENTNGVITIAGNEDYIRGIDDNYTLYVLVSDGEFDGKDELYRNIKSAYNNAYNGVAEDEIFIELKNSIEDLLGSEGKWEGSELVFDVSSVIYDLTYTYLFESHTNPLTEHSDFIDMLIMYHKEYTYALDVPNMSYFYPDSNKIEEWFNDSLSDYF